MKKLRGNGALQKLFAWAYTVSGADILPCGISPARPAIHVCSVHIDFSTPPFVVGFPAGNVPRRRAFIDTPSTLPYSPAAPGWRLIISTCYGDNPPALSAPAADDNKTAPATATAVMIFHPYDLLLLSNRSTGSVTEMDHFRER